MTLDEWIIKGEVGCSSKTMWTALKGIKPDKIKMGWDFDVPADPDDFRRCYLFYKQCELTKTDLENIPKIFTWWKPFVDNWDKMANLFEEESSQKSCPKLYEFMMTLNEESKILAGYKKISNNFWKYEASNE